VAVAVNQRGRICALHQRAPTVAAQAGATLATRHAAEARAPGPTPRSAARVLTTAAKIAIIYSSPE